MALRIAMMAETRPEVVAQVEHVMRSRLSAIGAQEYSAAGGVKSLADILNHSDRSTERNVLDELAKADGELAEEIRLLLFTFEDVVKLDDRSIQMVLKEVDQKDLAIALRGVSEDVRGRIFSNMSERGAELLREEIDFQPPQRKRVVEEAQSRIVGVVRRLEEGGAIVISRGGGRRGRARLMPAVEFDFEALEPLPPIATPVSEAEAVMDALADAQAEAERAPGRRAGRGLRRRPRRGAGRAGAGAGRAAAGCRRGHGLAGRGRRAARAPRRRARPGAGRKVAGRRAGRRARARRRRRPAARCAGSSSASASPCSSTRTTSSSCARRSTTSSRRWAASSTAWSQAERRVGRGGCIVRTPVGDVDARVETKLERAREVVADALGRS